LSLFFVFLLEGGQSWPWRSVQSLVLLVAVALLAAWAVRVERRSPSAIMPAWVWRNRTMVFTNLAVAAMGIVMMGPDTYLPTFTQASLGLGVIASGFVLASMSIGWPTASALSGKLYLRIGFRETALVGSVLVLLASIAFLLIPAPQPISLIVLDQVLIGAGFGLLFTPSLVGLQNMVAWEHRGVVTGANIFCRNLGQSLGAAVMGAIFNTSISHRMAQAPAVGDAPGRVRIGAGRGGGGGGGL
ncbi:MAG TPA: MFS transporter, partial [Flavobacteriales bacterium]|nr:MFS transporter [Flavobacteriales bacterium]